MTTDWVTGLECVRMELGEPDASGRRRPQLRFRDLTLTIDVDTVIMSLGTSSEPADFFYNQRSGSKQDENVS